MSDKDFLWLHLKELPYFRSLLRAVEACFYQTINLHKPTLDLGCGDGHFACTTFDEPVEVGLDPSRKLLNQAAQRASYRYLIQSEGSLIPIQDNFFASAISNSVLEHITNIDEVLSELNRVLQPGSLFLFSVPNHRFLSNLSVAILFSRLHLHSLAEAYRSFFNRISRHYHSDSPEIWKKRLEQNGFTIIKWWHYFSPQALKALEWGHYFGLPSLVSFWLFKKWILVPARWNLALTYRYLESFYSENPICEDGVMTFYVAQKGCAI